MRSYFHTPLLFQSRNCYVFSETEADCSNGDEQRETTQPIRGTHEWTESFVVVSDQTAAATATDL